MFNEIPLIVRAVAFSKHKFKAASSFFCSETDLVRCNLDTLLKLAQNRPDEMSYCTQVNLVHWVAHEHLVHTKVLDFPKCIKDQMSPGVNTEQFVVGCVGECTWSGASPQLTTGSPGCIRRSTISFPAAARVISRRLSRPDLDANTAVDNLFSLQCSGGRDKRVRM
jgi:hypothetical protein